MLFKSTGLYHLDIAFLNRETIFQKALLKPRSSSDCFTQESVIKKKRCRMWRYGCLICMQHRVDGELTLSQPALTGSFLISPHCQPEHLRQLASARPEARGRCRWKEGARKRMGTENREDGGRTDLRMRLVHRLMLPPDVFFFLLTISWMNFKHKSIILNNFSCQYLVPGWLQWN